MNEQLTADARALHDAARKLMCDWIIDVPQPRRGQIETSHGTLRVDIVLHVGKAVVDLVDERPNGAREILASIAVPPLPHPRRMYLCGVRVEVKPQRRVL